MSIAHESRITALEARCAALEKRLADLEEEDTEADDPLPEPPYEPERRRKRR